jgi:hypothetical protein
VKTVTSRVGADGVLNVTVPMRDADANKAVRVTVETMEDASPIVDRTAWLQFIKQTAGSITDPSFERHEQGEYEQRDRLP